MHARFVDDLHRTGAGSVQLILRTAPRLGSVHPRSVIKVRAPAADIADGDLGYDGSRHPRLRRRLFSARSSTRCSWASSFQRSTSSMRQAASLASTPSLCWRHEGVDLPRRERQAKGHHQERRPKTSKLRRSGCERTAESWPQCRRESYQHVSSATASTGHAAHWRRCTHWGIDAWFDEDRRTARSEAQRSTMSPLRSAIRRNKAPSSAQLSASDCDPLPTRGRERIQRVDGEIVCVFR